MSSDPLGRLRDVLQTASTLVEPPAAPKKIGRTDKETLGTVLSRRLVDFLGRTEGDQRLVESAEVAEVHRAGEDELVLKALTAKLALRCLTEISTLLRSPLLPSSSSAPPIGARDAKLLQTLAGIIARWGLAAQVQEGILPPSLREKQPEDGAKVIEVSSEGDPLEATTRAVVTLISPGEGARVDLLNPLRSLLLPSLFVPLLAALVQLGFGEAKPSWSQEALDRLLNHSPPTTVFPSLLLLLSCSRSSASPSYAQPALGTLLSRRLLRPDGVRGFLYALVGASTDSPDPPLQRLEAAFQVLRNPPAGLSRAEYFARVVPALIDTVAPGFTSLRSKDAVSTPAPQGVVKAACFVIGQLLTTQTDVGRSHVLPILHSAFKPSSGPQTSAAPTEDSLDAVVMPSTRISQATAFLTTLILNADPSPSLHAALVIPILPQLISLWLFLRSSLADPVLRGEVEGLVAAWVRTGDKATVAEGVRKAVEVLEEGHELSEGYYWARDDSGGICIRYAPGRGMEDDPLQLRPDPDGLIDWLAQLDQKVVSGKLLVGWLGDLEVLRGQEAFSAAKRTLLRLQLVMKMVDRLDSSILEEPTQILEFIKHAIAAPVSTSDRPDTAIPSMRPNPKRSDRVGLADLKIVDEEMMEGDVENDEEELVSDAEMQTTGLTLLLSVLEANPRMSASTTPTLVQISDRLESIIQTSASEAGDLAMQCRMLLAVRYAAERADIDLGTDHKAQRNLSSAQVRYREALKLLEDPILPVRAQGLTILRGLVIEDKAGFVPALVPAVLDIFLRAIQDDDSFIYFNAVKGLAAMAQSHADLVASRLAELYAGRQEAFQQFGKDKGASERDEETATKELDKRLRIGEAIVQVVQEAGTSTPLYVNRFMPALLLVLRGSGLPAPLRVSALTIMAACAEAAPLAVLPHSHDLVDACLTILSVESKQAPRAAAVDSENSRWERTRTGGPVYEETPAPLATDTAHVSLRRAAILFIALLFRSSTETSDSRCVAFPVDLIRRTHTVLSYVAMTDTDGLVQHQARTVAEEIQQATAPLFDL